MALLVVVLILIFIVYNLYNRHYKIKQSPFTCLLNGFWRAPKTFLIESGTELISLYIDNNLCDGWIIIKKEDGFILNDPITMELKEIPVFNKGDKRIVKYDVHLKGIESSDFPCDQSILYYPDCNKIILYNKNRIYAVMYKDCELTEDAMENHFAVKPDEKEPVSESVVNKVEEDVGESLGNDTEKLD